jgi:tetratricopeptide (TPR) repeat protein/WD40 repeat protein
LALAITFTIPRLARAEDPSTKPRPPPTPPQARLQELAKLAQMCESREDFAAARQARREVLALVVKLHGEHDWRVTNAQLDLQNLERLANLEVGARQQLKQAAALESQVARLGERSREALPLARKALDIRRQILGGNHRAYAESLVNLAHRYLALARFVEAENFYKQALDIRSRLLTDKHPDYANTLNDLANVYSDTGDYPKALAMYQKANGLHKKLLTENHPLYLTSLCNLASTYRALGDYQKALRLYQHALDIRKRLFTDKHPDYANSLNDLANVYSDMGDYSKALVMYQRANDLHKKLLTENHPSYATSLSHLASTYRHMGDYQKALAIFQEASDLYRKLLTENDPAYADSIINLASVHEAIGNYAKALAQYERVADLRKKLFTENHPAYADSLSYLANAYRAAGDYPKALVLCYKANELHRKLLTENHPSYPNSLNDLANVYREMGDYPKALALYQKANDLHKKLLTENHPNYASSLSNLASVYSAMGDYPRALRLYQHALDLCQRLLTENHPAYASMLNDLANVYRQMGDYPKALALYQKANDLLKKLLTENHPSYASSLGNLAAVYFAMGDYPKALGLCERTLELRKRLLTENHPAYADSLAALASVNEEIGDYGKALALHERALSIRKRLLTENHPDYAYSLHSLAGIYKAMGDFPKALTLYQQANDLYKKLLTENHPSYPNSLNDLANVYREMGDYPKALTLYQKANDLHKKLLTEHHPNFATSLSNVALVYREMGDFPMALPLYQRALDLCKQLLSENHPQYARSLRELAMLYQAMGDFMKATTLLEQALLIQRGFVDRTLTALSERQRLDFLNQFQYSLHGYLSVAPEARTPAARIYEQVLAWKGIVAARQSEEHLARDQVELQPMVQRLREVRAELAQVLRNPAANPQQQTAWLQRFDDLENQKEKLETQLARQSAGYRRLRELRQASAEQVSRALPPKTALVDFLEYGHWSAPPERQGPFRRERRFLAIVLVAGREPVCVPLGSAEIIEAAVQAWRQAVVKYQAADAPAVELAQHVWEPLRKHLSDVNTILIAPDGALCALPFGALPGRRTGSCLLEDMAIGYVTSGRALLEFAADAECPAASSLLAVGDVAYGDPDTKAASSTGSGTRPAVWKELPGTRLEIERIAQAYRLSFPNEHDPTVLTRQAADAARLKRELTPAPNGPRWRYLHLATHGFFEPAAPYAARSEPAANDFLAFELSRERRTFGRNPLLRSGFVLAQANRSPEQGILTAEEVADLDMRGTDLVVLSACETGLGKQAAAEGTLGLQRAFQVAGARTVAVSLWNVNDIATSMMMEEFYGNLWHKKLTKLEALRQAQLTVRCHPERIVERAGGLRAVLAKRGVLEEMLAARGIGKEAGKLPGGGAAEPGTRLGPPAWWAAFILSGDVCTLNRVDLPLLSGQRRDSNNLVKKPEGAKPELPPAVDQIPPAEGRLFLGHTGKVMCVAFSSDTRQALSGADDKTLRFWEVSTGKQLQRLDVGPIFGLACSPDGQRLLYGGLDDFCLWEPKTDKVINRFKGGVTWSNCAAFSPDGKRAIVNGHGNALVMFDLDKGVSLHRIITPKWITRFAASPDLHLVVTCSQWDNIVWLWDADTGLSLRPLKGHTDGVVSLAFVADSRRAISGSKDMTIRLWDTEIGEEVRCFRGHEGPVHSVAVSADGKRILSGSSDRTVRLWDVASGQEIACLRGHTGEVTSVAISPDGRLGLSASADHSVRLWELQRPH